MLTDLDYELSRAKLLKGQRKTIWNLSMIEFPESIEAKENWLKKTFLQFKCEKKWFPQRRN